MFYMYIGVFVWAAGTVILFVRLFFFILSLWILDTNITFRQSRKPCLYHKSNLMYIWNDRVHFLETKQNDYVRVI